MQQETQVFFFMALLQPGLVRSVKLECVFFKYTHATAQSSMHTIVQKVASVY